MQGEHPCAGPHRAATIIAKERGGLRLWEKFVGPLDTLEANQMAGVRHCATPDAEGEPRTYKQNPHDE